jgi:hypothetical protein
MDAFGSPAAWGPGMVQVIKTEEKGSDVNLAVALLRDAYENLFDCRRGDQWRLGLACPR